MQTIIMTKTFQFTLKINNFNFKVFTVIIKVIPCQNFNYIRFGVPGWRHADTPII